MKKHYKKIFLVFLVSVIFLNSISVYAANWSDAFLVNTTTIMRYCDLLYGYVFDHEHNYTEDFVDKFYDIGYDRGYYNDSQSFQDWWYANCKVKKSDGSDSDDMDGSGLNVSVQFKDCIGELCNYYKDQLDSEEVFRYKTTYCPDDLQASNFEIFNSYQNCKNKMNELASNCDYLLWWNCGTYGCVFYQCSVSNCALLYGSSGYSNVKINGSNFNVNSPVKVTYFNYAGNVSYTANSIRELQEICVSNNRSNGSRLKFTTNDGTEVWAAANPGSFSYCVPLVWSYDNYRLTYDVPYIFSTSHDYYKEFKSLADYMDFYANTYRAPYYKHDPVVSGNTITADQFNNGVNYGDVVGGNKYIIIPGPGNYITPVPDNGGGGGGGTIPDPNPNPGGGGGGGTNPGGGWDFTGLLNGLMSLIQAIFNLISSLVGYIAQLVGDLITTVTGLVDRLKLLVTGGVMELFTAFFPWLPPEVASLISLSFLLGVIIAIIKFIRG